MRRAFSLGAAVLAVACTAEPPPPSLVTSALTPPTGDQPAFEPHLAVDPTNPERLVVAAQYGLSRNRGGRGIWLWTSDDGGATTVGADMPLPGGANSTLAADAVTTFGTTGRGFLTFLFADSASFKGGAALTRTGERNLLFGPAQVLQRDALDQGGGAIDKGWVAVDGGQTSPLKGTIYLTWHVNRPLPNRTVESALWLTRSRDHAVTWAKPVRLADNFGGQIAVGASGRLTAVYLSNDERAILRRWSDDGGDTFEAPDTVAHAEPGQHVDPPSIAASGDSILVCWTERGDTVASQHIGCAAGRDALITTTISGPAGSALGFPAVAATRSGLWVLGYQADSAAVTVRLWRSVDGGNTFTATHTLASRPFGLRQFCASPGLPCRRTTTEGGAYFPGDYVGLAAGSDRLVAAFALPAGDDPASRSTIHLSVIRP